jgi:hypothetical protein
MEPGQQNGFEAVTNATELMAKSGGKNKRKFRLTNKNKKNNNK